jgi:hypothetical protein
MNDKVKKHCVIVAKTENESKLESFMEVMKTVASDMELKVYEDKSDYLIGADY